MLTTVHNNAASHFLQLMNFTRIAKLALCGSFENGHNSFTAARSCVCALEIVNLASYDVPGHYFPSSFSCRIESLMHY